MTGAEAAAVSALVSGTLKVVGNKLAPLIIEEYSSIVGVKEDLEELHGLILMIDKYLETVPGNATASRVPFAWFKKLKDISYDVDDVVDEFQLKAEKHDSNGHSGTASKYLCTIPKSFVFQCKIANKIKAIKKRLAIVKESTEFITLINSLSVDPPVRPINMRTTEELSLPNVDEELVVGRDKDKKKIISMLEENDDRQKIKIVSIIGLGGSGKTTLAKLVFNDIGNHFDVRLWVHVSQEFDVKELIKKLFEAFSENNPGPHALPYMTENVSKKLNGNRFLLVLDDVWTKSQDEWKEFMVYLKVGAPQSRILLTTRNTEVAVIVGSTDQFHLPFLSPDDCWQLFQQSLVTPPAFEFEELGKAIVDKCGGVPLAIKVLAGALHGKDLIEEWQAMRNRNFSNFNGAEDRVASCLGLSYFHLPPDLKKCFAMCSVFPKGHKIDKEQLIDLWIAHDMIIVENGVDYPDLKYFGHKHFESLRQVHFLQNIEEKDGRVTCGIHDLVHDLALSILGDEISLEVPNEAINSTKGYRYFSLIQGRKNQVPKNIFRKARAIYMADSYNDNIYDTALKHAKHLRSVTVGYLDAEGANTISQIKYLKYLAVSSLWCETLPEAISDVWSLQSLHVTKSYSLRELPQSIGKLKKLRTLRLSDCVQLESLPESIADCQTISSFDLYGCSKLTMLPASIGRLQKLRTLSLSQCEELKFLPDSIGDCQMISSIDLCGCSKLTVLPDSIGRLQKLRTLNLSRCEELKCLPDTIGGCEMISSIDLYGCSKLTVLPDSIGRLQNLRILNLSRCEELKCLPDSIGDCQMISSIDLCRSKELTVLPDSIGRNKMLTVLRLGHTSVERLPSSIPKLKNLECLDLQDCGELVELPEGIGNLEKLQVLNLKSCDKLGGMPVGIGQLSRLQKLGLFVVGKGEKFARISELANVSRIGGELTIRGISHVMDPNDAHMACLKLKTHLQRLHLGWMWMADDMLEINTELQQDVLDGLEPPSGIKEVEIHGYSGWQFAQWMQNQVGGGGGVQEPSPFPFLRVMELYHFPNLKHLQGLVELPCLEELALREMPSLESISGGPFPSLLKLDMSKMPCLEEVWMLAERTTMPDGEEGEGCYNFTPQLGQVIRVGNCLTELVIRACPKLKVMPHFPPSMQHLVLNGSEQLLQSPGYCLGSSNWPPSFSHLKKLELWNMTGLRSGHGWELLQHLTALESLEIWGVSGAQSELPESLWSLASLRSLEVDYCPNICSLPESIGKLRSLQELTIAFCDSLSSLPESMGELTSLQVLCISLCHVLHRLPDGLGELCSLRRLEITGLPKLTFLPQTIFRLTTSLQELKINDCPGLTSLPQGMEGLVSLEKLKIRNCTGLTSLPLGMKDLTALKELRIHDCPDLQRRCKEGTGEDWHLISHIPNVYIW